MTASFLFSRGIIFSNVNIGIILFHVINYLIMIFCHIIGETFVSDILATAGSKLYSYVFVLYK